MLDCQLARVGDRVDADDVPRQRISRMRTLDQGVVGRDDAGAELVVRQLVERGHTPRVATPNDSRHDNRQRRYQPGLRPGGDGTLGQTRTGLEFKRLSIAFYWQNYL